ncbi:MAG TPA: hypothetical protein VFK94_01460, partial [Patescibacteria group bacterium]|nr:hypothetical protein [Patescibacteria group bacterium]
KVQMEGAGFAIQEGCAAIYPDPKKGDCTLYPLHRLEKIEVFEDKAEEEARKETGGTVVPIRRTDA